MHISKDAARKINQMFYQLTFNGLKENNIELILLSKFHEELKKAMCSIHFWSQESSSYTPVLIQCQISAMKENIKKWKSELQQLRLRIKGASSISKLC